MKAVADAGFGTIEPGHNGKRNSEVFRKRKFCELDDQQAEILKQLKISRLEYEQSESPKSNSETSAMSTMITTPESSTSSSILDL